MDILKVKASITYYVETDNKEFGGMFRRGSAGSWEQQMGESWESAYSIEDELERGFQRFMQQQRIAQEG